MLSNHLNIFADTESYTAGGPTEFTRNSLSGDFLAVEEHEAVSSEAGHDVLEVDLPLAVGPRRPEGALARVVIHPDAVRDRRSVIKPSPYDHNYPCRAHGDSMINKYK